MLSQSVGRRLAYSAEQLFDIAADVERYPEFLRSWMAVRVRDRQAAGYCTDQVLGFGPMRVGFASETKLHRPGRIEVSSTDAAFRHFTLTWVFETEAGAGCLATLTIDIELRSRLLQRLLERIMPDTVEETMTAFEARARELCEPPRR